MIEDYYAPTNICIYEFGLSHPDITENIKETVQWLNGEGRKLFPYWTNKSENVNI